MSIVLGTDEGKKKKWLLGLLGQNILALWHLLHRFFTLAVLIAPI